MAAKGTSTFRLANVPFWHIALCVLLLVLCGQLLLIWFSGASETNDAFKNGRRLLVVLENGQVEGKYIADPDMPKADAAQAEKAKEEQETTAAQASAEALTPPSPALTGKSSTGGPIPVIGSDGTKPWRYYARPFDRNGQQPMIAIIITGLGQSKAVTEAAIKLPRNINLSFNPYSHDVDSWNVTARANGHETLVDLPMEPTNYPTVDPGPNALMTDKLPPENQNRLEWTMTRTQGYVGLLTPQNEIFSSSKEAFKGILAFIANHGLMVAMGHEPSKSDVKEMIEGGNTPSAMASTLIDEDLSTTSIQARLASLELIAKKRGYAIGIAQAYPLTIEQLNAWAAQLAARGIVLVPVTAIVKLRFS